MKKHLEVYKTMDLLNRLINANLFSKKLGLENMKRACALLGHPEKKFRSIHIAGSNGKGSVATKTAASLTGKIGLFTSPHIDKFNERIQINFEPISDDKLKTLLEKTFALIDEHKIPATFFEITTLIAFQYFANEQVDFAVLETGLGGRFDATNVVTPELSVITSISLEHTEILGTNIYSIAKEKAGIIKPGVPVIIGPTVPLTNCEKVTGSFKTFEEENEAIVKAILKHYNITQVSNRKPPCRLEVHNDTVPVIFDVAHNPDGLKRLFEALRQRFSTDKFTIVCGFSPSKDLKGCFEQILTHASHITLTQDLEGHLTPVETLKQYISSDVSYSLNPNPQLATQKALKHAIKWLQPLVICGSFYIMREAKKYGCQSKQVV